MSINLFNLSTGKNASAEGVKEGVHYKVLKDGHGVEHKILNFDNPDICPREGLIELEPMRRAFVKGVGGSNVGYRHNNDTSFRRITDKAWGVLVGIPVDIDPKTKQIIWKKIIVGDGELLDLSIPDDAMKWACIRRSPFFTDVVNGVEQNPNVSSHSKSLYKAVDRERAANTFELNRRTKRKAADIAENLVGVELEDYARNCGISPIGLSPKALWVEVVKFAEAEPEKFMAIHNSDTREELTVLNKAIAMGVVNTHYENGINYNGLTLGFNTPEALKYLKDHPQTLASIDAVSRKNDKETKVSMGKEKILDTDEANSEIARLRRELAAKKKQLEFANDKAIELQAHVDVSAIDPEFAELLKEAKRWDVKGAHNIKDKEKLRRRVEEKKSQAKN